MDVKKVHERQFEDLGKSLLSYYENPYEENNTENKDLNGSIVNIHVQDEAIVNSDLDLEKVQDMNNSSSLNNDINKEKMLKRMEAISLVTFLMGLIFVLFGGLTDFFEIAEGKNKKEDKTQIVEMEKKDEYDLSLKLDLSKSLTLDDKRIMKSLDYILNETLIELHNQWGKNSLFKFSVNFNVPSYLNNKTKKVELAIENIKTCQFMGERYFSGAKNIHQFYHLEINNKKIESSKMIDTSCAIATNDKPYNKVVYEWKGSQ